jgi:aerobic-type carbon monoxide dehydrogenase small subunit (CoxS/CutS family)
MKCPHEIYIPAGEKKALYCGFCNPGLVVKLNESQRPKKPRRKKNTETVHENETGN